MAFTPAANRPTSSTDRGRSRGHRLAGAFAWGALIALPLLVSAWGLADLPLYTKGEAREATQVWAEVHGGGWVLPLRNGVELPSKPPLFHWLAGLAALARGRVDELAMRLPSTLLAMLAVLAVAWTGSRRRGWATGAVAGVVLATSFEWMRAARGARVDMTLTACLTAALLSLRALLDGPAPSRILLAFFYASLGLGALAKGPVALALPALVAVMYLGLRGELRRVRELRPIAGGLAALAIPATWYAAAIAVGGYAFVEKQVLKENVFRFVGTGAMAHSHAHPFWYHGPAFLTGFLPWSLLLVPVITWLVRERRLLAADDRLFLAVWALVVFVFYSIPSSKRSVYLLPAYPAVALLVAAWWSGLAANPEAFGHRWRRAIGIGGVAVGMATTAVVLLLTLPSIATWIASLELAPPLASAILGIRARAGAALALCLTLVACGALGYWMATEARWRAGIVAVALWTSAAGAVVVDVVEPALAAGTSMRSFMMRTRAAIPPDAPLYFFGGHPDYEVAFYADRRLPTLRRRDFDRIASIDAGGTHVLIFERRWQTLDRATRARFVVEDRSAAVRDADRGHLLLARLRPPDAAAAKTLSSAWSGRSSS